MGIESHPFSNPYTAGLIAITDNNIQAAVDEWTAQPAIAAAKYGDIIWWDTGDVTSCDSLFDGKATFTAELSHWDMSEVTNLRWAFRDTVFAADISGWDVSKLQNMEGTFQNVPTFNSDISAWAVSSVTSLKDAFNSATSFAVDISAW